MYTPESLTTEAIAHHTVSRCHIQQQDLLIKARKGSDLWDKGLLEGSGSMCLPAECKNSFAQDPTPLKGAAEYRFFLSVVLLGTKLTKAEPIATQKIRKLVSAAKKLSPSRAM